MVINSRNENTRSGVAVQASGSKSGTASTSATVVVPVRRSMAAPSRQERAKSALVQEFFSATIALIQSANPLRGSICPAMPV